jgi:hypothetical protein
MRGPYNWTRSWENFGELLVDRFRDEIDPEIVSLKFSRIKTANQAFLKINETLIEVNVLPKNIGITTFKNLEFETKVSHAKSIPSLEMQFEKVEVIKDIFRNLSQPEIQLETFEISPDVWPLEKTQINLHQIGDNYRDQCVDIVAEYRDLSNEIKSFQDFDDFLNDLPLNFQNGILGELTSVEFYVLLLLKSKLFKLYVDQHLKIKLT